MRDTGQIGGELIGIIGAIVLIVIFAVVFLPALGQATGQDTRFYVVLLVVFGGVAVAAAIFGLINR
jgi:hypothetical protein